MSANGNNIPAIFEDLKILFVLQVLNLQPKYPNLKVVYSWANTSLPDLTCKLNRRNMEYVRADFLI